MAEEFTCALLECMKEDNAYKGIINDINTYLPFIGREEVEKTFIKSVVPLQSLIRILEGDLFDAGVSKLGTLRSWLQAVSFDLFLLIRDVHLEHSHQKPHTIPTGQPTAILSKFKYYDPGKDNPFYF